MDPSTMLDWQIVQNILISLALGAVVGLERQSHSVDFSDQASTGVRTFALASLLGTVSAVATQNGFPSLVYLTGAGYFLMVLASLFFSFREQERVPGITTEIAALIVFVLGVLVPFNPMLAAALGVIVAAILSAKRYTHGLVDKLNRVEIAATLKFLLLLVVLLPLLPDANMGPGNIYNPRELGYLVVLISAISFLGYFAIRFMGEHRGIALTGALGGLASSTAVTLSMCSRVREANDARGIRDLAVFGIIIADAITPLRLIATVAVVNIDFAISLILPLAALSVPGVVVATTIWFKFLRNPAGKDTTHGADASAPPADQNGEEASSDSEESNEEFAITNPFRLGPVIKFGLVFVLVIGLVYLARLYFGHSGTYIASFISGLTGVNAIGIALARMQDTGDIMMSVAIRATILAVLASEVTKIALCTFLGSKKLGLYISLALVPILTVGVIELLILG